ncbi:hypothetical protein [Tersicoccus sp. Bi-70]|uniref:hypothetical protein n=1 Tax=Tersicoccus sp. Bi-70 TaxID=1897634 RepID=UPI0011801A61|nr:hypothetical protein [Tersicoccus sp. Bi-70]
MTNRTTTVKNKTADRAATAALILAITAVAVLLAVGTELPVVVRAIISIVVGLAAAGVTHAVVTRRGRPSGTGTGH